MCLLLPRKASDLARRNADNIHSSFIVKCAWEHISNIWRRPPLNEPRIFCLVGSLRHGTQFQLLAFDHFFGGSLNLEVRIDDPEFFSQRHKAIHPWGANCRCENASLRAFHTDAFAGSNFIVEKLPDDAVAGGFFWVLNHKARLFSHSSQFWRDDLPVLLVGTSKDV